jgi:hypothetical protein
MKHTLTTSAAIFLLLVLGSTGSAAAFNPINSPSNDPRIRIKNSTSSNWSGYAVASTLQSPAKDAVTNVQGSWIVPAVTCTRTSTYSSMWVGIDGYSDATVEQTGTEQDCSGRGVPSYYAWYEIYPHSMVRTPLAVTPGNTINAAVQFSNVNSYTLTLTNATTGKSFTTVQRINGAGRESAEWIAEAPSSTFGVLPLSDFGTATFTNASATLNGHTGTISDPTWQNDPLTMELNATTPKTTPSALDAAGDSFSVMWDHR